MLNYMVCATLDTSTANVLALLMRDKKMSRPQMLPALLGTILWTGKISPVKGE